MKKKPEGEVWEPGKPRGGPQEMGSHSPVTQGRSLGVTLWGAASSRALTFREHRPTQEVPLTG